MVRVRCTYPIFYQGGYNLGVPFFAPMEQRSARAVCIVLRGECVCVCVCGGGGGEM
jgi:hypothetical protein